MLFLLYSISTPILFWGNATFTPSLCVLDKADSTPGYEGEACNLNQQQVLAFWL